VLHPTGSVRLNSEAINEYFNGSCKASLNKFINHCCLSEDRSIASNSASSPQRAI
jgi:hypothetical protein